MTPSSGRTDELRALLVLDRLPGVGPRRVRRLVECFGSATDALRQSRSRFASVAGEEAARRRHDTEVLRVVDGALGAAERRGMRALTWSCADYPRSLTHLADPPPVLFLLGRADLLSSPVVAVVGARRATGRARDFATRFAASLAGIGVTVASGMALGVDGAAHRGALAGGGGTIAVLGTGADVAYPRSHRTLASRIEATGLVVSEFLPGTPALPHHFPRRNRILAALARSVVVVEAGARSGSLITVDHALDLGREVWVVPGPVERDTCAGSNGLLLDGARPLLTFAHFASEWGVTLDDRAPTVPRDEACGPAATTTADTGARLDEAGSSLARDGEPTRVGGDPVADPDPHAVLSALAEGALSCDGVAQRLGLSAPVALALLTRLELAGVIHRRTDLRYERAA